MAISLHASLESVADRPVTDTSPSPRAAVKYAVEAVGTFFLVFTVGATVGGRSSLAPLAIGAVLMVMVYAGGHLSGGHYNPAVTLAVLVRGRIGLRDAAVYWVVQLGASVLAAVVVRAVVDPAQIAATATRLGRPSVAASNAISLARLTMTLSGPTLVAAFVAELLFTFALCYVVLNVTTSKHHPDNSFYGLAIGFTVLAGAVAVGAIPGDAFNPAVTLGAAVMHRFAWPTLWVYLVAEIIAGAAAGVTFLALNPDDK
jgi:aquaporin Z